MLYPLEGPGRKIRNLRTEKVNITYLILGKHSVLDSILQNHHFVISKFPALSSHIVSLHSPLLSVMV